MPLCALVLCNLETSQNKGRGKLEVCRGKMIEKRGRYDISTRGWLKRRIKSTFIKKLIEKVNRVKQRTRTHFTWSKMDKKSELVFTFTVLLCSLFILVSCHIPLQGTHPNIKSRQLVHTCLCVKNGLKKNSVNRLSRRIPEIMNFKYIFFGYPSPWAT